MGKTEGQGQEWQYVPTPRSLPIVGAEADLRPSFLLPLPAPARHHLFPSTASSLLITTSNSAHVSAITVSPGHRRLGLASLMMDLLEKVGEGEHSWLYVYLSPPHPPTR
jgi:ribosomal protein S18 acetylase RimI-like enzyme